MACDKAAPLMVGVVRMNPGFASRSLPGTGWIGAEFERQSLHFEHNSTDTSNRPLKAQFRRLYYCIAIFAAVRQESYSHQQRTCYIKGAVIKRYLILPPA